MILTIPPEILSRIFFFLDYSDDDRSALAHCARVSTIFHQVATPLLYKTIILSSYQPLGILATPTAHEGEERRNMLLQDVKTVTIVDSDYRPLKEKLVNTFNLPAGNLETIRFQLFAAYYSRSPPYRVVPGAARNIYSILERLKPRELIITDCFGRMHQLDLPELDTVETIIVNSNFTPDVSGLFTSIAYHRLPQLTKLIYIFKPEYPPVIQQPMLLCWTLKLFTRFIVARTPSFRLYMVNVMDVEVKSPIPECNPGLVGHNFVTQFLDHLIYATENYRMTKNREEAIEDNLAKVRFLTLDQYDRMHWNS